MSVPSRPGMGALVSLGIAKVEAQNAAISSSAVDEVLIVNR